VGSTRFASDPWNTRIEQGTVPYSRPTIEKKNMYTCYLRCNSVTNINIQRNTITTLTTVSTLWKEITICLYIQEKKLSTTV
jgi:hypothetical protein